MSVKGFPWFEVIISVGLALLLYELSELRADLRSMNSALRTDIRATNLRIDELTETVAQVRAVQAQHSVKLDQLLGVAPPVETAVLAHSVTK